MFPEPEGWRQDMAKEAQEIAQEFSTQSGRIYRNMSPVAKGDWLATLKKEGWVGKKGDEAWKAWADSNLSGQDRLLAGEYLAEFEKLKGEFKRIEGGP
jgi:hypothetical protein